MRYDDHITIEETIPEYFDEREDLMDLFDEDERHREDDREDDDRSDEDREADLELDWDRQLERQEMEDFEQVDEYFGHYPESDLWNEY